MWADRGDFLKLPFAKYCIEGVLKQDSSNVMLSLAQSDIGDWGAPCFIWPFSCICSMFYILAWMWICLADRQEWVVSTSMNPWKNGNHECGQSCQHDHISTTCWWYQVAKYRSDKLLATHRFLIMDHVTGLKSFGGVFMCLSAAYLTNVDQRWQRWLKVAQGLRCLPGVCFLSNDQIFGSS